LGSESYKGKKGKEGTATGKKKLTHWAQGAINLEKQGGGEMQEKRRGKTRELSFSLGGKSLHGVE